MHFVGIKFKISFIIKMKGKQNRKHIVPTDEPFVQNINLVTGDKFNYDRPLLTQRQINQLCVNENKPPVDKFMQIIKDGEKIQKWSVFQNIINYALSNKDTQHILETLSKNYTQYIEFLPIIGDGLANLLQAPIEELSKENTVLIYEIVYRTLTQNPKQVQDWDRVFEMIVKYPNLDIQKCEDYINDSFSMNSPPERRRVAFCMIHHLMDYSKDIKKAALNKVLFFNKDQNSKTRYEICCIMKKILQENPKQDEVWKAIWEYFNDKDSSIKELALSVLCNIFYLKNFQNILHSLSQQQNETDFSKYIGKFIINYQELIEQDPRSKTQIIAFFNRVFKSFKTQNICMLLSNLTVQVIGVLGEEKIFEHLNFGFLPTRKQIVQCLLKLYTQIDGFQFKDTLKNIIFKGLKQLQYEVWGNSAELASIFDLTQQDQISIYLTICNKMLQNSKWNSLLKIIQVFQRMILCQSSYQKACLFVLKLWVTCPMFLQQKVIECVIYLVLINRKSLQFLIKIRQKILNSKFWNHRRNYIIFYATIKCETSFEVHKLVPTLIYKNITADRSFGVRMTLLEYAAKIYMYTDPSSSTEKSMIKQAIAKLEEDKDFYVRQRAQIAKYEIQKVDKNSTWLAQLYDRSRQLVQKQNQKVQVNNENKKTIKTQHEISKSNAKLKGRLGNEQRKTINIMKGMHKEISIDSINTIQKQESNVPPKKNNLFRCHSVKLKAPPRKT